MRGPRASAARMGRLPAGQALLTLAGLLIVGLPALCAGSAMAAYPGANGRIAFSRADGNLYSIRANGRGLMRLGPGVKAAYSPDGRRIAFVSSAGGVWIMRSDGTGRRRVVRGTNPLVDYSAPTWSPDGRTIAFVSYRRQPGIFVVRSRPRYGTIRRVETTPPGDDFTGYYDLYPAWATNGLIYFTRFTSYSDGFCQDSNETMSVNPATHAVTPWKFPSMNADPAPRSWAMVYDSAWGDGACNLADSISIANIGGEHERAVTPLVANRSADTDPVFSPDAMKVAFARRGYVFIVNADGTSLVRLTLGGAPSWQPRPRHRSATIAVEDEK